MEKSKDFQTKKKLKEFSTTKPALQILKELLSSQETRGGKDLPIENKPKTNKKMAIGSHILIITLNVNGLNALTKRHRLAGG